MSTVNTISRENPEYPDLLKEIHDSPETLYVRGTLRDRVRVAIVGSRTPTKYGLSVAEQLSSELAAAGVEVVSGLAYGIDTAAHRAALLAGTTVAVLPGSVEKIDPRGNEDLANEILERGGVLLSENPTGSPVEKWSFPRRNRIIAGISNATVVIEAAERSGALITAQFALEQNRPVMAVPGSIYSLYSEGTNRLIRDGAVPVTSVEDILEHLPIESVSRTHSDSPESDITMALKTPKTLLELSEELGLSVQVLSTQLSMLEIDKRVYREESGEYVLIDR